MHVLVWLYLVHVMVIVYLSLEFFLFISHPTCYNSRMLCFVTSKHRHKSFVPEQDEVSFHAGYLRCASDLQLEVLSDSVEYANKNLF